ncbi:unnamed protein product [Dibothriocephalus latus]|uniref:Uncharacterized protein n=1 Tax=Dibothriocephalus latus TaxID=60516 RepID=A0A3P7P4S8_DIBLA|nr:unnamed protein product [Dibothriocephalus latus]
MNGENIRLISAPYQQCDDGQMHVITMERKGNTYTWHVDGHPTIFEDRCKLFSIGSLLDGHANGSPKYSFIHVKVAKTPIGAFRRAVGECT